MKGPPAPGESPPLPPGRPPAALPPGPPPSARHASSGDRIRRLGRFAWAVLGIVGVLAVLAFVTARLSLVVVPLILALFPATLLVPVARWLRGKGSGRTLAALMSLLLGLSLLGGVGTLTVNLIASGIPDVLDSAQGGLSQLEDLLRRVNPSVRLQEPEDLLDMAREGLEDAEEEESSSSVPRTLLHFTLGAVEVVAAILLLVVILFFYLRNGRQIAEGLAGLARPAWRGRILARAGAAWDSLGAYFRGQLLVALVDAVFIGAGLLLLGVPLALPLAILVFFGGLFPILGATVTGAVAVLVALSDGGLTLALMVAGLVLAVQQLESNVLEPLILSGAIGLHPLVIILSITTGAVVLGVLGAFLAVPVAVVIRVIWTGEGDLTPDPSPGPSQDRDR